MSAHVLVTIIVWFVSYVREDNSRALESGLSPVHMHKHVPCCTSMHVHFVLCKIFQLKHLNIKKVIKGAIFEFIKRVGKKPKIRSLPSIPSSFRNEFHKKSITREHEY